MDIQRYQENRRLRAEQEPQIRSLCYTCFQPRQNCYCAHVRVRRFDPKIKFVILLHNIEARRRIATGRMSHLCLENSSLIRGQDYSENLVVNEIIANPRNHCVILYPGKNSKNLTDIQPSLRGGLFPQDKDLVIFVIDGTWSTARKMVRSRNLMALPRICFSPSTPSNFRVRKQPAEGCYSTLEAIHHTIDLVGASRGFDVQGRRHDGLLSVFDTMVEKQLEYVRVSHTVNTRSRHHKEGPCLAEAQ
jgi:DTW domain-containing protein